MQLVFAYGVFDAARLLHLQGGFDAFAPPIDNAFFYPDTMIGQSTNVGNLITSICSITLSIPAATRTLVFAPALD